MSEQAKRAEEVWDALHAGRKPLQGPTREQGIAIILAALEATMEAGREEVYAALGKTAPDIAAALQEAERRGVEKLIAALVASPYSERIRYTRAEDWYAAVAARLLSQKEGADG